MVHPSPSWYLQHPFRRRPSMHFLGTRSLNKRRHGGYWRSVIIAQRWRRRDLHSVEDQRRDHRTDLKIARSEILVWCGAVEDTILDGIRWHLHEAPTYRARSEKEKKNRLRTGWVLNKQAAKCRDGRAHCEKVHAPCKKEASNCAQNNTYLWVSCVSMRVIV